MLTPDFQDFQTLYAAGKNQLLYTKQIADLDTAVSLFLKLAGDEKYSLILESVTGGEQAARYSILAMKPDLVWRAKDGASEINRSALYQDEFQPLAGDTIHLLRQIIKEISFETGPDLPSMVSGLFGYLSYDMIREVEALGRPNTDPIGTYDAVMMRPSIVVIIDNVKSEIIIASPVVVDDGKSARAAYEIAAERIRNVHDKFERRLSHPNANALALDEDAPQSNFTKSGFLDVVNKAKDYIQAGDIFQVVLSQRWTLSFREPPFSLYRALRQTNPSPYMFYLNFGDFQICGASPETLVKVTDKTVTIRPIAGTRPRGASLSEDRALEEDLLADKKELAEHLMLLDLGRNDVGKVAKTNTVKPTGSFFVERYSHVMHIVSNVEGELRDDLDALDALLSGLPAGTLSGAPKVRAMEIIDELEPEKRGIYGGGVGYFAANGDMDICIALRTAVVKDQKLYIQAGAGIVYDSDPEKEFDETVHKSNALFAAAREAKKFAKQGNS